MWAHLRRYFNLSKLENCSKNTQQTIQRQIALSHTWLHTTGASSDILQIWFQKRAEWSIRRWAQPGNSLWPPAQLRGKGVIFTHSYICAWHGDTARRRDAHIRVLSVLMICLAIMVLIELLMEKWPAGTGGYLSDDCYQSGYHNAHLRGAPHYLDYMPAGKKAEAIPTEGRWPCSHLPVESKARDTIRGCVHCTLICTY